VQGAMNARRASGPRHGDVLRRSDDPIRLQQARAVTKGESRILSFFTITVFFQWRFISWAVITSSFSGRSAFQLNPCDAYLIEDDQISKIPKKPAEDHHQQEMTLIRQGIRRPDGRDHPAFSVMSAVALALTCVGFFRSSEANSFRVPGCPGLSLEEYVNRPR